jgi:hypothetical protein
LQARCHPSPDYFRVSHCIYDASLEAGGRVSRAAAA